MYDRLKTIQLCHVVSLTLLLSTSSASPASAYVAVKQIPLKQLFHTQSDWRVTAYQASGPDASTGDVPAKICFSRTGGTDDCTFITRRLDDDTLVYNHQTVNELRIVALTSKQDGVLLSAQYSGGGSGLLNQIAIWSYDRSGDYFERVLTLSLTDSGSYQLVNAGPLEGDAISADYVWEEGESHFGSHRYRMSVNRYIGSGPHGHILQYVTRQKYPGADSSVDPEVIRHELPRISDLLRRLYGH